MLRYVYICVKDIQPEEDFVRECVAAGVSVYANAVYDAGLSYEDAVVIADTAVIADIADTAGVTDVSAMEAPRTCCLIGYGADCELEVKYVIENLSGLTLAYVRLVYARYHGEPLVVAETERLIIREMTLSDLPEMYELYDTLKDCRFIEPLFDWDEEREFCRRYIDNMYAFFGYGLWLVYEKDTGELVGRAGIENRQIDGEQKQEVGYLIRKDRQRKGYAYEAVSAILDYARDELCLREMFLCTCIDNKLSENVAQKLGFELYAADIDGMNLYRLIL